MKAFLAANAEQIKVAQEKKLKEVIYISDIRIDPQAMTARVLIDRILIVDSLRATTPWILDITFEYGPRSDRDPEGIYITGEKQVSS